MFISKLKTAAATTITAVSVGMVAAGLALGQDTDPKAAAAAESKTPPERLGCEVQTLDTSRQPVPGVEVQFRQYGTTNQLSVTTDATGRGRVSMPFDAGRSSGAFVLRHGGLLAGESAADGLPWLLSRASAPTGTWLSVSSVSGDTAFHPSAGWVVTEPSNAWPRIVMTMSESDMALEGRVITPDGNPLPGCLVTATRRTLRGTWASLLGPDDTGQSLTLQTRTDANGRYRIPAPKGEWGLGIELPQSQDLLHAVISGPRILNKEPVFDEIRLQPCGAVAVRVVDSEKKPVAGAELELRYLPHGYVHGKKTATDKDGWVRWRGLYAQRHEAVLLSWPPKADSVLRSGETSSTNAAEKAPMASSLKKIPESSRSPAPPPSRRLGVEVDVKLGEWANATLELPPPTPPEPAKKGDRILCVNLADETRTPLGGMTVEIQPFGADPLINTTASNNVLSSVTSTNGAAVFSGLTPGLYRIKVRPPATTPYAIVAGPVSVSDTEAESTARVIVPQVRKMEGTVRDDAGTPVPGAEVAIRVWALDTNAVPPTPAKMPATYKVDDEAVRRLERRMDGGTERDRRDPSLVSVSFAETVRAGPDGRFVFERVPLGSAQIEARSKDADLLPASFATNLSLTASQDITIALRRRHPLTLSGIVTGEDGQPIQGVTVMFKDRQTVSDPKGYYRFDPTPYPWPRPTVSVPKDLPYVEGAYATYPSRDRKDKGFLEIPLPAPGEGGDFRFDITLQPVLLARLKLEDAKGAPVTNCPLEIQELSESPQRRDLMSRIESPYRPNLLIRNISQSNDKGIFYYKVTSVRSAGSPSDAAQRPGPLQLQFIPVPLRPRPTALELPIQGKAGSVVDCTLRMEASHDVAVQVIEQSTGKGVPAEVTLVPMDITQGPDMQKVFAIPVRTDSAGTVKLCGLLAPKYRVEARSTDTNRFFAVVEQPLIEPQPGLNGVEIVMRETGGLVVSVADDQGVLVPSIPVTVWGKELGMVPRVDNPRYWTGATDVRGTCRIPLCGGTVMVEAKVAALSGSVPGPVFVAPPRQEVQLSTTSTSRIEVRLQRGAVVCVRLLSPDGEPRKRDILTFQHKTLDFTASGYIRQEDANSYWVGPLLPGAYSIAVRLNLDGVLRDAPPSAGTFDVTVGAGDRKDIELRLKELPQVPTNTLRRISPASRDRILTPEAARPQQEAIARKQAQDWALANGKTDWGEITKIEDRGKVWLVSFIKILNSGTPAQHTAGVWIDKQTGRAQEVMGE